MKSGSFLGLIIAGVGASQGAFGADVNVTTSADSTKVGAEFRAELNRDDHGLQKVKGTDPDATTTMEVQTVKLKLSGNLNKDTQYAFRFNLLNPDPKVGPLDYGYGTHWFSDMFGFSIGKEKVMQGGWDTIDDGFRDHWKGAYKDNLFVSEYTNMVALHLKVAGQINLQIINDKTTQDGGEWNKTQHPTFAIGWLGKFGPIAPIVDLGTVDNQKSRWIDVGVKTDMAGLQARLDIRNETLSHKVGKDSKEDTSMAYTVFAGYDVKNVVMPYVYYSMYDKKQNKDVFGDDRKGNEYYNTTDPANIKIDPQWNDNKMVMSIGANLETLGNGWTPYIAYTAQSGKFYSDVANANKTETKTEGQVKLGVLGEF